MNYSIEDFLIYKKIISQKGFIQIKIISDSMSPLIKTDEILIVAQPNDSLKRFDIVVFWQNNKLTCHYLWKIHEDPDFYFFKSLKYPQKTDKAIEPKNILGVVQKKQLSFLHKLKVSIVVLLSRESI